MADVITTIGAGKDYATPQTWHDAGYGGAGAGDDAVGNWFDSDVDTVLALSDVTPLSVTLQSDASLGYDGTAGSGAGFNSSANVANIGVVDIAAVGYAFQLYDFEIRRSKTVCDTAWMYGLSYGQDDDFVAERLLIHHIIGSTTATRFGTALGLGGSRAIPTVKNCIAYLCGGGTGDVTGGNGFLINAAAAGKCYNNTAWNILDVAGVGGDGIIQDADVVTRNCLAIDCDPDYSGTAHANNNYNADSDNTAPGANSVHNETSAVFVNTGAGTEDLRLSASAGNLVDAGIGPASDAVVPTMDIDGTARAGTTCDIGADEYVGGAPSFAGSNLILGGGVL